MRFVHLLFSVTAGTFVFAAQPQTSSKVLKTMVGPWRLELQTSTVSILIPQTHSLARKSKNLH